MWKRSRYDSGNCNAAVGKRAVMRCQGRQLRTPGAIILQTAVYQHDRFTTTDHDVMQGDVAQSHRLQRRRTNGARHSGGQSRCATDSD
jgi:hypothetical protein